MTAEPSPVEPVAIVGMANRFPDGNDTPDQFWDYLIAGRDAIGDLPEGRWDAYAAQRRESVRALHRATRYGSFLTDPALFDAAFFGVTPREAELMDPQQRLALETTWEALEHAGIPPHTLAGSDTGVYMGVAVDDYGRQMLEDLPRIEAWCGIGAAYCAVANRISYTLDLRGPSLAVDTACSSSLVAVHLACDALRRRECAVAIAGGVNVIAGPGMTLVLDAAGATSPHGRSRPFDADADGYGRGEGSGTLILKRLDDALAAGDRVLAVVRGSAISQDGRTNGIMAPNGEAQEQVARLALGRAGVDPLTVAYVEAHGTGTRTGDPIEVASLSAVFGRGRAADRRCLIGSLKGNIGHLEAGAGVAGVIKAVLAMEHGELPPQASFATPNPLIDWDTSGLDLVARRTPWPDGDHPRRAGVSGYGYGGTVAHVLLEQAPARPVRDVAEASATPRVFPLSGNTERAVREYAAKLADAVGDEAGVPDDVRHTLWQRRTHLRHRAAVVAHDAASLRYELRKLAENQPSTGVSTGRQLDEEPVDAVWVFSGHGSQWVGMGRELLTESSVFAEVIDTIEPIFRAELGFSPRASLTADELGTVDRVQALIFAVQVGLAAVWRDLGLRPAAVIGHSVGEVAAAVTAGVFDVADGARLICRRSRQVGLAAGGGAMVMVPLPFDEVRALLADDPDAVAAIESSPLATVVAGTPEAVAAFGERCRSADIPVRRVASDVAFHTPQMDPLLPGLKAAVAPLRPRVPNLPLYSTALPDPRTNVARDADYWTANLRNPVRLGTAVCAAAEDGHRIFLEVSPHPVVTHSIVETMGHLRIKETLVTGTLRRSREERATLLASLAKLFCHGVAVDPARQGAGGTLTTLPRIAWQHERYWRAPAGPDPVPETHETHSASLLGAAIEVADPAAPGIWRTRLEFDTRPYRGTHPVHGVEIVPAAVMLTTCFGAAGRRALTDVDMRVPITMDPPREVQVIARDGAITLASRPMRDAATSDAEHGAQWEVHTTAAAVDDAKPGPSDPIAWHGRVLPPESVVERLHSVGITGSGFTWTVKELLSGERELLARVDCAEESEDPDARWSSLVDAVMTIAPLLFDVPGEAPLLRITAGLRRIVLDGAPPAEALIRVRPADGDGDLVDALITDDSGTPRGTIEGLRYGTIGGGQGTVTNRAHHLVWTPAERTDGERPRTVVLVGGRPGLLDGIDARARESAVRSVRVADVEELAPLRAELDQSDAVLVLGAAGADAPAEEIAWTLVRAAQLLADRDQAPSLVPVTVGVREGGEASQAVLWGLGRVVDSEYPGLWGGTVDLAPGDPAQAAEALFAVLGTRGPAQVWAPRDGGYEVPAWVPADAASGRPDRRCRADATYVVIGGFGATGGAAAHRLAGLGARRLLLTGRRPLPPRAGWADESDVETRRRIETVLRLEAQGVSVHTAVLDVTDPTADAALTRAARELPPIRGVVLAVGDPARRKLGELTREETTRAIRAGTAGAALLNRLFPDRSSRAVDFLVGLCADAHLVGGVGQATQSAVGSVLAAASRASGLCTVSWGDPVPAEEAFDEAERGLRSRAREVAVLPVRRIADTPGSGPVEDADELGALSPQERTARLHDVVAALIAAEIRMPKEDLDMHRPLSRLGLDSVMTLAIRQRLEQRFDVELPPTLMWRMPTGAAVADHVDELLASRTAEPGTEGD